MARKYDIELSQQIKEQEYKSTLFDIDVLIKPVPDSDLDGVIDPRLFKSSKKIALILKYMPKPFLKIDMTSSKGVKVLRKMFNRVNSCQVFESGVEIQDVKVRAEDGYQIPLIIYRKSLHGEPGKKSVLYYIHGGGFLQGTVVWLMRRCAYW